MTSVDSPSAINNSRERIVRMRELAARLALSSSHLYALIKTGRFPRPVSLIPGGRAKGWTEQDISKWLKGRVELRDSGNSRSAPQGLNPPTVAPTLEQTKSPVKGGRP
jgi:prophage regulatory protein